MFGIFSALALWVGLPVSSLLYALSGSLGWSLFIGVGGVILIFSRSLRVTRYFERELGPLKPAERWQTHLVGEVADQMNQLARQWGYDATFRVDVDPVRVLNFSARDSWILPLPRIFGQAPTLLVSEGFWVASQRGALTQKIAHALLDLQSPALWNRCVAAVLADWTSRGTSGLAVRSLLPSAPLARSMKASPGAPPLQALGDWFLSPILTYFIRHAARSVREELPAARRVFLGSGFPWSNPQAAETELVTPMERVPLCVSTILCATHALPSTEERVI